MRSGDFNIRVSKPTGKRAEWTVTVANGRDLTTAVLDARKPEARDKALADICANLPAFGADDARTDALKHELEVAGASWHDRKPEPQTKQSSPPLPFDDVKPATAEVDLSALLNDLSTTILRFIVLPDGGAETVALWICHTWCLDATDCTPRLVVCSPVMRCGKTTLLEVVRGASRRAIAAENTSTAALFRAIEKWRPTIILDEADNLLVGKDADRELRGILNGGHRRGGSVLRSVGDDHTPTSFNVFGPVAFGLIGDLPSALMDRSIVIRMYRKTANEHVDRIRPSMLKAIFEAFRPRLARWSEDNLEALNGAQPSLPGELGDRAQDIWEPLLAIAELADDCWADLARTAAVALSGGARGDDAAGLMLLVDIRAVFKSRGVDQLPTKGLLQSLIDLEEQPWSTWFRGRELSDRQLARLLKPFGVKSKDIRQPDGKNLKGYALSEFADAFARYIPEDPQVQSSSAAPATSG